MPLKLRLNLPLILLLLFAASLVFAIKITAQANYSLDKQNAAIEGSNQENWTLESEGSIVTGANLHLLGTMPPDILNGMGYRGNWIPGGFAGTITNSIASLYAPQASGVEYLAQLKNNFLGRPALAQNGTGFTGLQPLLPIWRAFRNVAYIISSLFFVIIGILIILRVKISPQAVISIQNAIPQVITTLILITFSYAIAGLIIDLALLIQGAALALLFTASGISFGSNLLKPDLAGILQSRYNFAQLSDAGMVDYISLAFLAIPKNAIVAIGALLGATAGAVIAGIPSLGTGVIAGALIGPALFILIVSILVLVWLLKFFFGALKCYVTLLFKIIIAPLEIGIGAFPNSKMGFNTWIWDVIANIAVFPISFLFLVIANMIIQLTAAAPGAIWAPNMITDSNLPAAAIAVFTMASGGLIPVAIGLSTLMLLSKLPDMIPQFVFQIKPSPWGSAIGQTFSDLQKPVGKMTTTGLQFGSDAQANRYQAKIDAGITPTTTDRFLTSTFNTLNVMGKVKRK